MLFALILQIETVFLQYGVLGAVALILGWYILKIEKEHKEERKEWRDTISQQFKDSNKTIQDNTSIVSAFKALFEQEYNKKRT